MEIKREEIIEKLLTLMELHGFSSKEIQNMTNEQLIQIFNSLFGYECA